MKTIVLIMDWECCWQQHQKMDVRTLGSHRSQDRV